VRPHSRRRSFRVPVVSITVRSHDELLAAMPHMFGFTPEESIVLYPFSPGLPRVRADLPTSQAERDGVWDSIAGPIERHAAPGSAVAVICWTGGRDDAERASADLRTRLESLGVACPLRLWTDAERWADLDTQEVGSADGGGPDPGCRADGRARDGPAGRQSQRVGCLPGR